MPESALKRRSGENTHVLLIEDNPGDAYLVRDNLRKAFHASFNLAHETTESSALQALAQRTFDVCLLDLSLPDADGLNTLQQILARQPDLPVLILTGTEDDRTAQKAVAMGAQDYLLKHRADAPALRQAIDYAIERKRHHEDLVRSAFYDPLTGLARRDTFMQNLTAALARASRSDRGVAVFFLDLDKFKHINDTWGHDAGDRLLQIIAGRLKKALRPYDVAARFGGDEFIVLVDDATSLNNCAALARKLIAEIAAPLTLGAVELEPRISIGIASTFQRGAATADTLVKEADIAMYLAKSKEAGGYAFFTPADGRGTAELAAHGDMLVEALRNGQLQLYYQPRIETSSGKPIGAEALLRWCHPERGLILPGEFMPLANHTGLAGIIDKWVLGQLSSDMKTWKKQVPETFRIGLNISANMLKNREQTDRFYAQAMELQLDAGCLSLDIPESAFLSCSVDQVKESLKRFIDDGFTLHLDHFGRDTAAFLPMLGLPFNLVRIDKSLIVSSGQAAAQHNIFLHMLCDTAHHMNMRVGCVGLEKQSQWNDARDFSCDEGQGYAVAVPMPMAEAARWIQKHLT